MTTEISPPPAVQKIEGSLTRRLSASLSIRAESAESTADGAMRLRLSASSEEPYLRQQYWDDPWVETLGHNPHEVDLERLAQGGPVLANHERYATSADTPLAMIGAVERAWLENGRLMADIVLSRRESLAGLRQDIADGLVRNVSIGYLIHERALTRTHADGSPPDYRVTRWAPYEISLVDVPADATVGIGRGAEIKPAQTYRVLGSAGAAIPADPGKTRQEPIMPEENDTVEPQNRSRQPDPIALERERSLNIAALGRQHNLIKEADAAIESGAELDSFRKFVLDQLTARGAIRPAESAEIGMSKKDLGQFSIVRALLAAGDPANAARLAPFEFECSRAAQDKRADSRTEREAAITIPVDVLSRGFASDHVMAESLSRQLIERARQRGISPEMTRDLLVGTASAGGNTVATELFGSSFIDILRNAMVIDQMGSTFFRDLNGNVAIPSQTGAASTFWVAENGAVTESAQTFGQVTLTPKTVGTFTDYSRRLMLQSSIDIEMFVRNDLAQVLGLELQRAAIHGSGASNEPTGILATVGIGSVVGGTNGLAPTYDHIVDLETAVANANAAIGGLAYLTNTRVRGKLRKTQQFTGTNGMPVWTSQGTAGVGEMLGYSAYVSNSVSNTLTKGTSSGVASAILFGNWSDLLIGMWGGLDLMLDPYTGATAGTKRVVALMDCDIAVRRAASFAAMVDALTA